MQQPKDHIRVGDSLKLFCNITIAIHNNNIMPLLNSSNINVSSTWTKMNQSSSDPEIIATSSEVTEIGRMYMYSSTVLINSLMFSDSASYTCTATISPRSNSPNMFTAINQSSTIPIQLSKLK